MAVLTKHTLIVCMSIASLACPLCESSICGQASASDGRKSGSISGFFSRHPVIRKATKGAALGVLTGGLLTGALLGHTFAEGAALGAGEGASEAVAKHHWQGRKRRSRIAHRDDRPVEKVTGGVKSVGKGIASGLKKLVD